MILDDRMPTLEEIRARSFAPPQYANHVVVSVGADGPCYWKHPDELTADDWRVFFDGDCRDVLAPDDPRVIAALKART